MGLDIGEARMAQILLDQPGVAVIVQRPPHRHRLGPEAAVRKADDNRAAGAQDARRLAQQFDRALEVLDRDADHRRVDAAVAERQDRVAIEILHEPAAEARVRG